MRTMLKMQMPVGKSNQAVQSGQLPKLLERTMQALKPESAYFFTENGRRTCMMVFDMKDSSLMPAIAEPLFAELEAEVTFTPVMNADDLKKGLEAAMTAKAAV